MTSAPGLDPSLILQGKPRLPAVAIVNGDRLHQAAVWALSWITQVHKIFRKRWVARLNWLRVGHRRSLSFDDVPASRCDGRS
jgi:hypothetical protein